MSNRLDKLFKDGILRHHLPNDGPNWDQLDARMKGKKRNPFVFLGWSSAIVIIGMITVYFVQGQKKANKNVVENSNSVKENSKTIQQNIKKDIRENAITTNTNSERNPSINSHQTANTTGNQTNNHPSQQSAYSLPAKEAIPPEANNSTTYLPKSAKEIEDSIRSIRVRKPDQVNSSDTDIAEVAPVIKEDTVAAPKPVLVSNIAIPSVLKKLPKTPHLLSIYALYSPALIKSTVTPQEDNMTNKNFAKLRKDGEKMKNSLGLDFGIRFSPFKRLSFSAGFMYEKRTETVEYHFLRDEGPVVVDDSIHPPFISGYFTLSPSAMERIDISSTNTYTYLGIPLSVNFDIPLSEWFGIGMQLYGSYIKQNSLQGKTINKTYIRLVDLTNENTSQLKNILNAGLGLNLRFSLTSSLILSITPDYKMQLSKNVNTTSPMQTSLKICLQYFIF